jgi:nucleoside-diphosphate kinase
MEIKAQVTGTTETPLQPEEWYSFYTLDNTTNTTAQSDKPFTYDLPSYPPMQVKSDKPLTQPEIDQILDKLDNLKKNNTSYSYDEIFKPPFKKWAQPTETEGDNTVERTLVMLKPDAFERNLVGEIIDIISQKGMKLIAAKQLVLTPKQIKEHYQHHVHKPFFPDLVGFMTSGPCMALVFEGDSACMAVRQLIGQKHPSDSPPGSIRGRYATDFPRNLIHGSDNAHEANYEISLYFSEEELLTDERVREHAEKMKSEGDKAIKELQEKKKEALSQPLEPGTYYSYPEQIKKGHLVNYSGYYGRVEQVKVSNAYQRITVVVTLAHNGMVKTWHFPQETFNSQTKLIFMRENPDCEFGAGTENPGGIPLEHPFWKKMDNVWNDETLPKLPPLMGPPLPKPKTVSANKFTFGTNLTTDMTPSGGKV